MPSSTLRKLLAGGVGRVHNGDALHVPHEYHRVPRQGLASGRRCSRLVLTSYQSGSRRPLAVHPTQHRSYRLSACRRRSSGRTRRAAAGVAGAAASAGTDASGGVDRSGVRLIVAVGMTGAGSAAGTAGAGSPTGTPGAPPGAVAPQPPPPQPTLAGAREQAPPVGLFLIGRHIVVIRANFARPARRFEDSFQE